jgi:8-oxo-dGTP pyrophosphatase MutT (NUDIX family)
MKPNKVRTIAICLFRHDDQILVAEGYDEVKRQTFYRPLGGTIEFGEYSDQTIVRELQEELGAEVTAVRYLFTLENVFTFNGQAGHEIVLVYDGTFVDPALYERSMHQAHEDDETPFTAKWMSLREFATGNSPLYPAGLLEALTRPGAPQPHSAPGA